MKIIITLLMLLLLLVACAPVQTAEKKPAPVPAAQNITPTPNVTKPAPAPAPQEEEAIVLNKSINTLYNNKQQRFRWGTYTIELLYVSSDGELCQIRINGKTGIYEKDKATDFDSNLKVEVMDAVPTHGFTGDACKVAFYNPN